MRENLSNPRCTKAEDKIGLMIREHIRPDQMIETEGMMQTVAQDRITEVIESENILEETIGRIVGKGIEVREITIAIELGIGIGQETGILQGIIEGMEALIAVDLDQDPEQVQIGAE